MDPGRQTEAGKGWGGMLMILVAANSALFLGAIRFPPHPISLILPSHPPPHADFLEPEGVDGPLPYRHGL